MVQIFIKTTEDTPAQEMAKRQKKKKKKKLVVKFDEMSWAWEIKKAWDSLSPLKMGFVWSGAS